MVIGYHLRDIFYSLEAVNHQLFIEQMVQDSQYWLWACALPT